jgi:hypothetical protein
MGPGLYDLAFFLPEGFPESGLLLPNKWPLSGRTVWQTGILAEMLEKKMRAGKDADHWKGRRKLWFSGRHFFIFFAG